MQGDLFSNWQFAQLHAKDGSKLGLGDLEYTLKRTSVVSQYYK